MEQPPLERQTVPEHPGTEIILFPSSSIVLQAATLALAYQRMVQAGLPYDDNLSFTQNFQALDTNQLQQMGFIYFDLGIPLQEQEIVQGMLEEYRAMQRALVVAAGNSAIQLVDFASTRPVSPWKRPKKSAQIQTEYAEDIDSTFPIHNITLMKNLKGYPRDYYTRFGSWFFVNKSDPFAVAHLKKEGYKVEPSTLGEGGAVLSAGKSIIVSDYVASNPIALFYIDKLKLEGFTIMRVPLVKRESQPLGKKEFNWGHIDGHAALLTDPRTGKQIFLYAKSYARQDRDTRMALIRAALGIQADRKEIDDDDLPPLAFNMVQLPNGKVICPRGGKVGEDGLYVKSALEEAIADVVGEENLIITEIPIVKFPKFTQAGIRCLTNIADNEILKMISYPGTKS